MRALISGASGQDGILISWLLRDEGHEVVGVVREETRGSELRRYVPEAKIVVADLADSEDIQRLVVDECPDIVFNFGGVSTIMESIAEPELTWRVNALAVESILRGLQELRRHGHDGRLVQASSSAIYETTGQCPQDENTAHAPRSPYAKAKAAAMNLVRDAREKDGIHACSAILFNHESPLRGTSFVTRRISRAVAEIAVGDRASLDLGNIDVSRDWGWAPDYVRAMRLMSAASEPSDYVLATGELHTLREFLDLAFDAAGLGDWTPYVRTDEALKRETEPVPLVGDSSRAERELGWSRTTTFPELVCEMVRFDMQKLDDPDAVWDIAPWMH